jgi:hypothetical protein
LEECLHPFADPNVFLLESIPCITDKRQETQLIQSSFRYTRSIMDTNRRTFLQSSLIATDGLIATGAGAGDHCRRRQVVRSGGLIAQYANPVTWPQGFAGLARDSALQKAYPEATTACPL